MLLRASPGEKTCPYQEVSEDPRLGDKDASSYVGWYHTDVTIPAEYFRAAWRRPSEIDTPFRMDLTYLHQSRSKDFHDLAVGRAVSIRTAIMKGLTGDPSDSTRAPGPALAELKVWRAFSR